MRAGVMVAVIGVAAGCSFDGVPPGGTDGGGSDALSIIDSGAADAPTADAGVKRTWTVPVLLNDLSPFGPRGSYDDLSLTDDGLIAVFGAALPTVEFESVYIATRASTSVDFPAGTLITSIDGPTARTTPNISADGLRVTYSARIGGENDLFIATRPDRTNEFGTPTRIPDIDFAINSANDEASPYITQDGLTLVFSSNRPGGAAGNFNIYISERLDTTDPFGDPVAIDGVNTTDNEFSPTLSEDRLTLTYCRIEPLDTSTGDIYISTRSATTVAFPAGVPVDELNSEFEDCDLHLSNNGRTAVLSSRRSVAPQSRLYISTRIDN